MGPTDDVVSNARRLNDARTHETPWTWEYNVDHRGHATYFVTGPSDDTIDIGYEEDARFIAACGDWLVDGLLALCEEQEARIEELAQELARRDEARALRD